MLLCSFIIIVYRDIQINRNNDTNESFQFVGRNILKKVSATCKFVKSI